jgi:hypothetical protein
MWERGGSARRGDVVWPTKHVTSRNVKILTDTVAHKPRHVTSCHATTVAHRSSHVLSRVQRLTMS